MMTRATTSQPFPYSKSVYEALGTSGKSLKILGTSLGSEQVVCAECPFQLAHPVARSSGWGRSSGALGLILSPDPRRVTLS
jgi:hypothetical protein